MALSTVGRPGCTGRIGSVERYGIRVVLLAAAVTLTGIPFGWLTHQVVSGGPLTAFDERFAEDLHARMSSHDALVAVAEGLSLLGKPIVLVVVVGLPCLWLLRHGASKLVMFLVVTTVGGGLVESAVKLVVGRPRPEFDEPISHAFGNSFPSGHSMSSVIGYGALYLVFASRVRVPWRRLAALLAVVLPLSIGFSRLALGVHFVSDVVGGVVLGIAWLVASVAAFELYRIDRGRPRSDPLHEGVEPEEIEAVAVGSDHHGGEHHVLRHRAAPAPERRP